MRTSLSTVLILPGFSLLVVLLACRILRPAWRFSTCGTPGRRSADCSTPAAVPAAPQWARCDRRRGQVDARASSRRNASGSHKRDWPPASASAAAPRHGRNLVPVACLDSRRSAAALAGGVPRIDRWSPALHIRDTNRDATQPLASRTGSGLFWGRRALAPGIVRRHISGAQALVHPHVVAAVQVLLVAVPPANAQVCFNGIRPVLLPQEDGFEMPLAPVGGCHESRLEQALRG